MWLFSLFPFHVCVWNRTLKNLFQLIFITLFFFYPTSFTYCLRSNTKNNTVSLLNLSLHFQGWCLTSKSLLCTCINKLCYQNSTTNLQPKKNADSPGTGENFVLILAVKSAGPEGILRKNFPPLFPANLGGIGTGPSVLGAQERRKERAVLQSVRAPVFCQAAPSHLCCAFQQLSPYSSMFSLHFSPCYRDLAFFFCNILSTVYLFPVSFVSFSHFFFFAWILFR